MELIIDVSASAASAGLARGGEVIWSGNLLTTRDHTTMLLPQILEGMTEVKAVPEDISLTTVATGPGPFNGLRVALAIAKGISVARDIPVFGVSSLLAEVSRCHVGDDHLRPIMPAGKTTYATALFRPAGASWQQVEDAQVMALDDLAETLSKSPIAVCGDIEDSLKTLLVERASTQFVSPQRTRIQSLASLGHERAGTGDSDNIATLQPTYVRPPHITKPRERRH